MVKAIEPLSTALLAVPLLKQSFNLRLFMAILVAAGPRRSRRKAARGRIFLFVGFGQNGWLIFVVILFGIPKRKKKEKKKKNTNITGSTSPPPRVQARGAVERGSLERPVGIPFAIAMRTWVWTPDRENGGGGVFRSSGFLSVASLRTFIFGAERKAFWSLKQKGRTPRKLAALLRDSKKFLWLPDALC